MQIIEQSKRYKNGFLIDAFIAATVFILAGILYLLNNFGYLQPELFDIVISWEMLVIVIGIWSIVHRNIISGMIITFIGAFFLIPNVSEAGEQWINTYWPAAFILTGIIIFINLLIPKHRRNRSRAYLVGSDFNKKEGFISSDNSFGNLQQIVFDEVLKEAKIKNNFGLTILDLRRTTLEPGETKIEIDSKLGSIEIIVPPDWTIKTELISKFSKIKDKRFCAAINPDNENNVLISGKMCYSNITIKN